MNGLLLALAVALASPSHDAQARLTSIVPPSGAPSVEGLTEVAYGYDGLDQLLTATEAGLGAATTIFTYGDRSELKTVQRGSGGPVTYGYDSSTGRLTSVASPSGTVSYGYDGSGMQRLNQVSGPQGSTQVAWNPGGELATLTTGSYQELRCYDGAGRISEVQNGTGWLSCGSRNSGVVAGYAYGYDGRGNRTSEEYFTGTGTSESTTYGYDSADRLTGVQYGSLAVLYGLAGDGTRLGEKRVPAYAGTLGTGGYEGANGASEALAYGFDGQGGLQTVTDTVVQQTVAVGRSWWRRGCRRGRWSTRGWARWRSRPATTR